MPQQPEDPKVQREARRKTAMEIRQALEPLSRRAETAGLTFVAYLLAMAAHHTEDEIQRLEKGGSRAENGG